MARNYEIEITGNGSLQIDLKSCTSVSAYVRSLEFTPERPNSGNIYFDYLSSVGERIRFRGGRVDLSNGEQVSPRISGDIIDKIRMRTEGIPEGTTVTANLYTTAIPDASMDERVYQGYQALTTQPFAEANVKNGRQFYINRPVDLLGTLLAASGVVRYTITTGAVDVLIKTISVRGNTERYGYRLFKNPVISTAGAPVDVFNYNDDSPVATSVEVREQVTVSSPGDAVGPLMRQIGSLEVGNRPKSGPEPFGIEYRLARNRTYLLEVPNLSTLNPMAGDVYITWYEGPLSSGL